MIEKLKKIFKEVLEIDNIDDDLTQKSCPEWDSLRHITLIAEIEDAFKIELDPIEIEQLVSFSDVISIVRIKSGTEPVKEIIEPSIEKIIAIHTQTKTHLFFKRVLRRFYSSNWISSSIRIKILRKMGYPIGTNTYIGEGVFISDRLTDINNIVIGDNVDISGNVSFVTTSGPVLSKWKKAYPIQYKPITIENDVWIGTGAIILPGVKIGEASIIGAGCVVDKDIPPYSVVQSNFIKIDKISNVLKNKLMDI